MADLYGPATASTIPLAANTFSASRSAVRLTASSCCNPATSSVAPSGIRPPRIRRAKVSTVWPCTPRRAYAVMPTT